MTAMRRTLILLLSAAALSTTAANKTRVSAELDPCAAVDCASGLVCALATPQSCNVAPCPKMPVCLPKNQTCETSSCKADETCVLRSVTCIMAPCYPVKECAKFPKCGANEEYNECSLNGPCEPNCKEAFPICSNVTCGSGACECKTGYYRHNGACITRDQCPTPTCAKPNEVWSTCPSACPQTCRILRGKEEQMMCPAVCGTPQCTCATGYVRDDDWNCVMADDCPKEFACDSPHEEFVTCSTHCEPTCDNRAPTCIESCGPAKCQCKKDYVRHEGSCLFALQCPMEGNSTASARPIPGDDDASASGEDSGENNSGEKGASCDGVRCEGSTACSLKGGRAVCAKCKKHEKIDPCPNACAQASCEDGGAMRKCAAIKMCGPQACVCADGFVRNMRSGECVKREKCPKVDNNTMHILPMPANWTEPLILTFPETENGTMHIMPHIDPIPANWTRPAPRPFFPPRGTNGTNGTDGTMHILPFFPPKDEGVHIMPVDELIDPIPRNWTKPLILPFPGTENGTAHIMPHIDPIPSNWTRPMRPQVLPIFVKENNTVHFANGTVISVPYVPGTRPQPRPAIQNGTMHNMPHFEGSAHILPFIPRGGDHGSVDAVAENETMISLPYVPRFDNGTMHILPFLGGTKLTQPLIDVGNETMHILPHSGAVHTMPLIDPIPANWTRPAPRPARPGTNGTMHIMPVEELVDPIPRNWTRPAPRPAYPPGVHIMPVDELVDPIPTNWTRPMRPQVLPIFANWTKPLIRPAFPDNSTDGQMHIMPIFSDPIPANWTRPAPRPHFGNDTMISGPYVPNFNGTDNGTMHILPHFGNETMHILPFPVHGGPAVHVQPIKLNGTVSILPFFPAGNDSVSGGNGAVHIMPFVPVNSSSDVCANHTCPAGHWCEETPVMCLVEPCPPIATCVSTSARGAGGARDEPSCGKHEVYSQCAPACPDTCRGVDDCVGKPQSLVCKAGCVCKNKFKRDQNGVCVPRHKCWKTAGCQDNEIWYKCRACEPTCADAKEICTAQCVSGCGCDDGFVRGPTGACIEQKKCPKTPTATTTTKTSGSTAPVSGPTTTAKSPSTTTTHKA